MLNISPINFTRITNNFAKANQPIKQGLAQDVFVKSTNKALLLVEIIQKPTCIKNAFGKNKHQFLYFGATLKKDIKTGQITGIDKNAFNSTWQVL